MEYHDRSAIEGGALAGQGLEIAWFADKVDVFFIHVQGAARLNMTDGRQLRVTYAAKSGSTSRPRHESQAALMRLANSARVRRF